MHNDIKEILITEEEIREKCIEIGRILTEEYKGRFPLLVGVLKGATPFMADLSRYRYTRRTRFHGRLQLWKRHEIIR